MSPAPASLLRSVALFGAAAFFAACERAAPAPPTRSPAATAAADALDPTALGLSDLARTSRYVFRVMGREDGRCGTRALPPGRWEYTIGVSVGAGRVKDAVLAGVSVARGQGAAQAVPPENWPLGLQAYVSCLRPKLLQVVMDPAPADGVYPTQFIAAGEPEPAGGAAAPR